MMRHPIMMVLAAALALPLSPTKANAQAGGRPSNAAAASLGPVLRERVDRLADSARVLGVPTDPLYLKAAEGVLKGADDSRVIDVVRRLLGELTAARRVLGPESSVSEIVAGANVIHARVDPDALRALRGASAGAPRASSLVMPMVVIADLVSRRVTADIAVSSVRALMVRGAPDEEFATLRTAVERDIAGGQAPDLAMRTRTDLVLKAMGPAITVDPRVPPRPGVHP